MSAAASAAVAGAARDQTADVRAVHDVVAALREGQPVSAEAIDVLRHIAIHHKQTLNSAFDFEGFAVSLLVCAIEGRNTTNVERLIIEFAVKAELEPETRCVLAHTPLTAAIEEGNPSIVRVLLNNGARADTRNGVGKVPADYLPNDNPKLRRELQSLLYGSCKLGISPEQTQRAVELCAGAGDPTSIKELRALLTDVPQLASEELAFSSIAASGADDGESGEQTTTLLYTAARASNVAAVELLLNEFSADPNVQISDKNTPMHVACYRGAVAVVAALLRCGKCNLKLLNVNSETCLSVFAPTVPETTVQRIRLMCTMPLIELLRACATFDAPTLTRALAVIGADEIVYIDPKVKTTLLLYSIGKNSDTVRFLLQHGANPNGVPRTDVASTASPPSSPSRAEGRRGRSSESTTADAAEASGTSIAAPAAQEEATISEDAIPLIKALKVGDRESAAHLVAHGADAATRRRMAKSASEYDFFADLGDSLTPAERAFNFVTGRSSQTCTEADFDAFVRSVPPTERDGAVGIPAYLAASVGMLSSAPLLTIAAACRNLAALNVLLRNGAIGETLAQPGCCTALHVAVQQDAPDVVEALLAAAVCDVHAVNDTGKSALDLARSEAVRKMLQDAIAKLKAEAEEAAFQRYVATLPSRREDGKSFPSPILAASGATPQAVLSTLRQLVGKCIETEGTNLIFGHRENPVTRTLVAEACAAAIAAAQTWTLQEFMAVAPPRIFPTQCTAAVSAALPTAARNVCQSLTQLIDKSIALDEAVANFRNAKDLVEESVALFRRISEGCAAAVRAEATLDSSLRRVARTFYEQHAIDALADAFRRSRTLLPAQGLLDVCSRSPPFLPHAHVNAAGFRAFLQSATISWRPEYSPLVKQLVQLTRGVVTTSASLLSLADDTVEAFLRTQCTEMVREVHAKLGDDGAGEVVTRFVDLASSSLADAACNRYHSPASAKLGFHAPMDEAPDAAEVQRVFCDCGTALRLFSDILETVRDPSKRNTNVTPKSDRRFAHQLIQHVERVKSLQKPPTTPREMLDVVLRPMNLQFRWRMMPIYEQLDTIDSAMAASAVVLVEAHTGSGKSVLLPQHLANAGYNVIVTQPRRMPVEEIAKFVASVYGAERVGYSMGGVVNARPRAPLQFRTDFQFLGESLRWEGKLPAKTVVVIDEVHERNAAIDMLLLTLLHVIRETKPEDFKVVLASATVDPTYFQGTATSFGFKLEVVKVHVAAPFKITDLPPPSPPLPWPEASGKGAASPPKRPAIAARDAFNIVKGDASAKVLVFLPHVEELLAAVTEFANLCSIRSAAVHANTTNIDSKVKNCRVIFANNVAETSLTIPGLTHVLDFNLAMHVEISDTRNCRLLTIGQSTKASQVQRRGRLGRRGPGFYKHYYDIAALPATQALGLDILPNDELANMEMLVRCHLRATNGQPMTLFAGHGARTLGIGIAPRPRALELVPSTAAECNACARIGFLGGMALAFNYAQRISKCQLAVVWLSAMVSARELAVQPGTHLDASHAPQLGKHGDHGVLLDLMQSYREAKKRFGTKFNAQKWAQTRKLNPHYFENADARIERMVMTATTLGLNPLAWGDYSTWSWADLEDCLMAGYWKSVAARVRNALTINTYNYSGMYHHLDSHQTTNLALFRDSVLNGAAGANLPDFVFFGILERRAAKGRFFMHFVSGVSRACVQKWSAGHVVHQSIGLIRAQDAAHAAIFAKKPYPHCKIERSAASFTPGLQERSSGGFANMCVEFQFTGAMCDVLDALDDLAADINLSMNPPLPAAGTNPLAGFGMPTATLAQLRAAGLAAVAKRLEQATARRPKAQLRADLGGSSALDQILAIANVLVNDFNVQVKGGLVRDAIVRGLGSIKDVDCVGPGTLTPSGWRAAVAAWQASMNADYGVTCTAAVGQTSGSTHCVDGLIKFHVNTPNGSAYEVEMVAPWHREFTPAQNMDFACNNLAIDASANASDLKQLYPIGMTAIDIVRQLCVLPAPQTSPHRDSDWVKFAGQSGSVTGGGEGAGKNMWLEGKTPLQKMRIDKFRKDKKYWFVEAALVTSANTVRLMHGTNPASAAAIVAGGFRPSLGGNLGAGVYMSRNINIVKMFASPSILIADVDPGKIVVMSGFDSSGSWAAGGDSAFLSDSASPRKLEEWCIRDPKKITNIKQIV